MTNAEKKNFARTLFIKTQSTRRDIAFHVGVTEKTLRNWIADDRWEEMKNTQTILRSQLLQDAYVQLAAVNLKIKDIFHNVPDKQLSDAKGMLRKEIETLSQQPLHKYVEVFEEYIEWVAKNQPISLQGVVGLSNRFIEEIAKRKN